MLLFKSPRKEHLVYSSSRLALLDRIANACFRDPAGQAESVYRLCQNNGQKHTQVSYSRLSKKEMQQQIWKVYEGALGPH